MTPHEHQPPPEETSVAYVLLQLSSGRLQTRIVLRIIAIILAVVAFLWIVYKLTAVLLLLVLSIFFAYLVAPLVDLVERPLNIGGRVLKIPRGLAIGIVYVVLFVGVGTAIYFLAPQFAAQFPEFKLQAVAYYQKISSTSQKVNEYFKQHRMPEGVVKAVNDSILGLIARGGALAEVAAGRMLELLISLPWLILIPILSFFLLKDADSFRRSALAMLPRGRLRWRGDEFFQDINQTLAAYIRAQLTACLIIGVVCSVGFALIGLPSPLVLGLIAGMLEFVPLIGPLTVAILVALLAVLYTGGLGMTFVVLLFLGVLRVIHDYAVYPRIIGQGIHLHPLAVILAIMAGAEIAGVAGIFLAIPLIAILTVTYRHWLEHRGSETIAEVLEEAVVESEVEELASTHPTATTTPDEMARARPDLLTGELKPPKI